MDKKILLVDDDEMILEALADMLSFMNFQPITATSKEKCLQKLKENSIAVLILDYKLEESNAVEIIDPILKNYPQLKIIISSGIQNPLSDQPEIEAKIFSYLNKPFDFDQLEKTLLQAIK